MGFIMISDENTTKFNTFLSWANMLVNYLYITLFYYLQNYLKYYNHTN